MTGPIGILRRVLRFLMVTLLAAVAIYALFALFFSTDVEKALQDENRMYAKLLPAIQEEDCRRADAIAFLQHRDNAIYELVFHSGAPGIGPLNGNSGSFDVGASPQEVLIRLSAQKSDSLIASVGRVDSLFADIFSLLASDTVKMPMLLPVRGISYPQVGAGQGKKVNPFLKALVQHGGLDLLMERGDTVYASAAGVAVIRSSSKKEGNTLEILHPGGYVTRLTHLQDILVRAWQQVGAGQAVATVGMTGASYAPHLHYEISLDGNLLDPVDFVFASLGPEDYLNMLYMSENTVQSMD